jgi:hypothetical protein
MTFAGPRARAGTFSGDQRNADLPGAWPSWPPRVTTKRRRSPRSQGSPEPVPWLNARRGNARTCPRAGAGCFGGPAYRRAGSVRLDQADVRSALAASTSIGLDVEFELLAFLEGVKDASGERRVVNEDFRAALGLDETESAISNDPNQWTALHANTPAVPCTARTSIKRASQPAPCTNGATMEQTSLTGSLFNPGCAANIRNRPAPSAGCRRRTAWNGWRRDQRAASCEYLDGQVGSACDRWWARVRSPDSRDASEACRPVSGQALVRRGADLHPPRPRFATTPGVDGRTWGTRVGHEVVGSVAVVGARMLRLSAASATPGSAACAAGALLARRAAYPRESRRT